jgi:murein L,D-transpeptidase YafK
LLKNILYISGSVVIFFAGVVLYGVILNIKEDTLAESLSEKGIKELQNVRLFVDRKNYRIELYSNNTLVKTYKAVFGKNTNLIKSSVDDNVTPIGDYVICSVDTSLKYHKFLHLNYPNQRDAAEALKQGYINNDEFNVICLAEKESACPPKETRLGSEIGIHGIGTYNFIFKNLPFSFNWTNGSIAVSNENIDELYSVVKIGTVVRISY